MKHWVNRSKRQTVLVIVLPSSDRQPDFLREKGMGISVCQSCDAAAIATNPLGLAGGFEIQPEEF